MGDWHRAFDTAELPDGQFVFGLTLTGSERWRKWWAAADGDHLELCHDRPG